MPPLEPEPVPEPCSTGSPWRWPPLNASGLPVPLPASVRVGFSTSLSGTLLQVQSAQEKLPRSIQRLASRLLNTSEAPLYSCSRPPLVRNCPPRVLTLGDRRYQVMVRVEPSGIACENVVGMKSERRA